MINNPAVITLTTDFGTRDPYVGSMKGAILTTNPHACIVDITHEIRPGAVSQAAFFIEDIFPCFPRGTIHVAVVDPGVGGKRRPIVVEASGHLFVGPDNGVFWKVMENDPSYRAYHLNRVEFFRPEISMTFHGRDIFGPVAAHISKGVPLEILGEKISDPVPLTLLTPRRDGDTLLGEVIRVDRFGNIITNIKERDLKAFCSLPEEIQAEVGALKVVGIKDTYCNVAQGTPIVLFGSSGYLEIAVNQGRAAELAGISEEESGIICMLRRCSGTTPTGSPA